MSDRWPPPAAIDGSRPTEWHVTLPAGIVIISDAMDAKSTEDLRFDDSKFQVWKHNHDMYIAGYPCTSVCIMRIVYESLCRRHDITSEDARLPVKVLADARVLVSGKNVTAFYAINIRLKDIILPSVDAIVDWRETLVRGVDGPITDFIGIPDGHPITIPGITITREWRNRRRNMVEDVRKIREWREYQRRIRAAADESIDEDLRTCEQISEIEMSI
jgi:hypothetical protein